MKISTKGRYALAVMLQLTKIQKPQSGSELSKKLGLSKIYLEQVVTPLRTSGLINAAKGSAGGYSLTKPAETITCADILINAEPALFEVTGESCLDPQINAALNELVYLPLQSSLTVALSNITLFEIAKTDTDMFYI